ncbi:hypothetical protein IC615_27315 [Serratia ureilytica]
MEQLASLRVTPNAAPGARADQVESAVAWQYGIERNDGPTTPGVLAQNLTQQPRTAEQLANVYRGGYAERLRGRRTSSDCHRLRSGYHGGGGGQTTAAGRKVRVVSMPSTDAFDKQDAAYRESVLPAAKTARVAVKRYRGLLVQVRGPERRYRGP